MEKKKIKKQIPKKYRWLRIFARIFAGLILLFFLLVLFIRSPWGQDIIVQRAVKYVSGKTNTKVAVDKLFITFGGNIMLKGLYLEDKKGDTLVYSKSLEADVPLLPIIRGNGMAIHNLDWEGLRANILRKDSINGYNFQFLIDAFAAPDTTSVTVDTTAAPMDIILGAMNFKDFNIVFEDAVLGIESQFKIGKLALAMKKTDLENMDFQVSEASIFNTQIRYKQTPIPPSPKEDTPLPFLALDALSLKNVFVDYQSQADGIAANLEISDLYLEMPKADLVHNIIEVGDFRLKNSIIQIHTENETNKTAKAAEALTHEKDTDKNKFEWPDLKIEVANIDLEKNNIAYFVGKNSVQKDVFNPNAISLQNFTLKAKNIFLKEKKAGLQLETLNFKEESGFYLKEMSLNIVASDTYFEVDKINLALNNTLLKGKFLLEYPTLAQFIEAPDQSKVALEFPTFQIDLDEILKFQPELKKNEYLATLRKRYITGSIKASGFLSSIHIPTIDVRWGNSTQIIAGGTINNATDPNKLSFNIPRFYAQTNRLDLLHFVDENQLGVSLPHTISLNGNAKGNLQDMYANATLNTSQGIASLEGYFKNNTQIAFNANIEITEYKLDELLKNEQLGALSLSVKTSGKGSDINSLDANLNATISSFQFNNYSIQNWAVQGDIKNGKGTITSNYKDESLHVALNAGVVLDSVAPAVNLDLNLIGANLQSLGVMARDVRTTLKLNAAFKGNADNFDVSSAITDGVVVYDNKTYLLGNIFATAHVQKDTTSIWLDNKIVQLQLESNADPTTFGNALQRHIAGYFSRETAITDTIAKPVKLNMKGRIAEDPVLNEVFLVNLQQLDTVQMAVNFDEKSKKLKAAITSPHINYGGNEIDSLSFSMDTNIDAFAFNLGFKNITAGPFDIQKTQITGNQQNNLLTLGFTATHKDSTLINIQSQITKDSTYMRFHVVPSGLILNKKEWQAPNNNEIFIYDNRLEFKEFRFSRNNQSVEITDAFPNISEQHIAIDFKNFRLSEFLNYLNPDEKLVTGNLNGNLIVTEPFNNTALLANLFIEKLHVLDVNLGRLTVDGKSLGENKYDFNLALKEGEVDLDLDGDYVATETEAQINLGLDIHKFNMKALEGFSMGELIETSGNFSGNFNVAGSLAEPKYEGTINFNDAAFKIAQLNAPFTLVNEKLQLANSGLSMNNFIVRDENNNKFIVNGTIGTESFINPTFNLQLKATNFQVLNATKEDNSTLYGKVAFNVDATVQGDLQIPEVNVKLDVNNNTDVTYVMPTSSVAIEERDGVVIFVNRENPEAILTQTNQETGTFSGFDVNALLKIGKGAKVKIILDEETGDNFEASGEGDLDFRMKPTGQMTLAGVYEIAGGHYEMNLYNLVKRKFELAPGGRVTWSGDPFDAKLDVSAIYKLETSASALMLASSSGSDPSIKSKYRQVLPFQVYLNVDGALTQPVISFNLDMPKDEQGAIGGQVYGRVQQLNQQEDELNRQVFSLLVLNRFYPDPGSDGSGGGFATVARDNINDAVSDQLNTFSNKLLTNSGVELDFGLDSYTDYQGNTPQDRTQLEIAAQKKLFNDRLIVRVGSEVDIQGSNQTNEPTPLIGNVSLEYLLTENGRYRLRGFRRNQFDNVIDGQTIASGLALIFTQEFNKFDEFWQAILKGETEQEKRNSKEAAQKKKEAEKQEKEDALENQTNEKPIKKKNQD